MWSSNHFSISNCFPCFPGPRFFRVQVFQARVQGPGPGSGSRFQKQARYKTLPKKVADHQCRKKTTMLEELHIKYYKSITRIIFMYGISLFIGTLQPIISHCCTNYFTEEKHYCDCLQIGIYWPQLPLFCSLPLSVMLST